jgi:hypothetical protein
MSEFAIVKEEELNNLIIEKNTAEVNEEGLSELVYEFINENNLSSEFYQFLEQKKKEDRYYCDINFLMLDYKD